MSKCEPNALIEGPNYHISQCKNCDRFGLHFNNILMGFEKGDFYTFIRGVSETDFNQHAVFFPDNRERILLSTPIADLQINLTREEFEELKIALIQCNLILNAREMIGT
ncbi:MULTISPECIES: DUF6686 family protein [Reichenbachiella]|uniref:Uncharacterized protein n=1 Tax=Reichenbachiella agariperforans TaxID=156994 RepID=A0A1M6NS90_REIAG|nr:MULTISPECIES: DUF6686 family protein [Reichenbachiella]MBU2916015.1 hypothetical protein [Reichenbachiella agariperforans]RJE71744.1 hypothetical protein BGP76_06555 [Reichenbachiella sp. MSK19-1]SHJ98563.1 hypothetical protein SAMN04488028_102384 [Reichenbachiella agariperforans]